MKLSVGWSIEIIEIIINNKPLLVKLVIENEEGYLNLCKLLSKQKNLSNLLTYSKSYLSYHKKVMTYT